MFLILLHDSITHSPLHIISNNYNQQLIVQMDNNYTKPLIITIKQA